jgi:hypothetical protein
MNWLSRIMATAAILIFVAGCAPKNSVVGTWQGSLPAGANQTARMTIVFNPDGTEVQTIQAPGQTIRIDMKYTAKDGTLTQTFERAMINGRAQQAKVNNASFVYKVEGDTLTLSQKGVSSNLVLTRIQS